MVIHFNHIYEKEEITVFKYQGNNVVYIICTSKQREQDTRLVFLLHGKQDIAYKQADKWVLADHNHCREYFSEQDMFLFLECHLFKA